jgi:5-methylthioadenosine/S-adenosylhomocysteine deaminase
MLIAGATVFTVDENDTIFAGGHVRAEGREIVEVSPSPLAPRQGEEVIDATGHLLLPGFVNTHTHLFQTLLRGVYEERPLGVYLDYIYRSGLELSREDCHAAAVLGSLEAIRSGTTTVTDHHFLNRVPELAQATVDGMRDAGVRAVLARTLMDMGPGIPTALFDEPASALRQVDELLQRYRSARADRSVTIMTGPNTPGMNASAEAVRAAAEYAAAKGIRQSAHVAEYKGVVAAVKQRYGIDGVVNWLDGLGALNPEFLAVHAVQVAAREVDVLARCGCAVSHNPFSNLFCGDRNAPVGDYLAARLRVGLGTDGAANNNAQGVLDALRITRLLQRAHPTAPNAITPAQGLRMATIDGARALGLDDVAGSIEPGKRADLALVQLQNAPHTVPTHDPLVQLVHSVKTTDVRTVFVDGRCVMRDWKVASIDEPAALRRAAEAGQALVARLG